MSKLPTISGMEVKKRLEKAGFNLIRWKGSHIILRRERAVKITISIPDHKELKKGHVKEYSETSQYHYRRI